MVSFIRGFVLGAVVMVIFAPDVAPQLTPNYCTTIVSNYQACPATLCYSSVTRTQCCMGLYRTTTGTLYQQCVCSRSVNCSPVVAAPATTAAPFSTAPLYCGAAVSTPICGTSDPCFSATTRTSCCIAVERVGKSANAMLTLCRCDSAVQCPAVPVLP